MLLLFLFFGIIIVQMFREMFLGVPHNQFPFCKPTSPEVEETDPIEIELKALRRLILSPHTSTEQAFKYADRMGMLIDKRNNRK